MRNKDINVTENPEDIEIISEDISEDILDYTDGNLENISLSRKERFQKNFRLEQAKLKQMSPKKKTAYIVTYYKWHFILFAIFVIVLVSGINLIYRNSLPIALNAFILNNDQSIDYNLSDHIIKDFSDYYDYDNDTRVYIQDGLSISLTEDVQITSTELTDYEKVIIYIQNKELDILITDQDGLDYYSTNGEIYPLETNLPKEEYEDIYSIIGDDIVSAIAPDESSYECAIDISNTEFAKKYDLGYDGKMYLCIPGLPRDVNRSVDFIKYVYGK